MKQLFKNRNFSLLWTAGLISMIGNWMIFAALPFYVYELTGSALATSGILLAMILPGVLFSSVAGVFVDRWDRRKVMIVVNLAQAATIPFMLLVQSPQDIWLIYLVLFLSATFSRFFFPAESALLPNLVAEEHLQSANSMNALNDNLARIIGPAIGGVLLGVTGFGSVVLVDAATYLIAAVLITLVVAPAVARQAVKSEAGGKVRDSFIQVWRELVDGLKLVSRSRLLASAFIVVGIALFGDAIISAVLVVFVQDEMALTAVEFGWMMTARGLGGLIGGLLIAQFGSKISRNLMLSGGLLLSGMLILVIVTFPSLAVALPLLLLVGIPAMAWIIALQTLLQQGTADEYRGRIFGTFGTVNALLMAVGTIIAGGAADALGSLLLMTTAAGITIFAGLLAWVLLTRPVRELDMALQEQSVPDGS